MKKSAATQWILVILLFISNQFAYNAQTLDATFSSPATTLCSGSLFTLNATTSSYQSYSWTISGPNAFTSNLSGSSTSLNLTEAGTYNVSLTVSDGVTSETNTVNGYLNALTPAIANAGVDQTVCAFSSVTLNGSVSGPATTIYWSGGMGTFSPNMANLTSTYSPSANEIANGFVNLILTTNDPVGPCPADQDTVMILFNSLPIVSAPASICVGSTEQLSSSSGGTWTSSNATISTINAISGLATGVNPGNVTFTFTNNTTGCSKTTNSVTVNSTQSFSAQTTSVCSGNTFSFTPSNAQTGTTYTWSAPNAPGIVGTTSGTNQVNINGTLVNTNSIPLNVVYTVTPSSGPCSGSTFNVTVTVNPLPTFTLTKTDPTSCNATNGTITILGLTPNTSYQYSYALFGVTTGPITTTSNSSGQITIFGLSAGSYTLSLILTATGCQSMSQVITLVNPSPPAINSIADTTVCGSFTLPTITGTNLSGNQAFYTAPNGAGGILTGSISTTQTLFMYDITPGGCSDQQSFTVTVNSTPSFSTQTTSICSGGSFSFTPSNAQTGTTYTWSAPNAPGIVGTTSGTNQVNINGTLVNTTSSPINVVYLVTPNSGSCVGASFTLTVTVIPVPNVADLTANVCSGNAFTVSPVNSMNGVVPSGTTYTWTVNNNANVVGETNQTTPQASISQTLTSPSSSTQVVNYIVTPSSGSCSGPTFNVAVTVNPLPTITLSSNSVCVNSTVQLTPNSEGTWVSNNQSIASITNAGVVTGLVPGTVNFSYTNTANGCVNTSNDLTVTSNATVDSIPNQVYCASEFTTPITFSGSAQQYNWTNDNANIGLAASGANTLPGFTTINTTGINQVATITVTPVSNSCTVTPSTFTITVKPLPSVNPVPNQIVCHNQATQAIAFSGSTPNIVCAWNQNNAAIGCANNGYGNIPSFYAQNTSTVPQIAPFQAIPILNGCYGDTITFSITVNPNPTINQVQNQTVCHNDFTQTIVFSGSNPGTVYNWTQDSPSIGCAGSGSTNFIPSFVAQNTTTAPQIATFTATPSLNGCFGTAINFTITVNPSSTVDPIPNQVVCPGELTAPITFSGSAQQYNWTNDNVSVGLQASGTGNIVAFSAINNTLINQVATITVTPVGGNCNSNPTTFTITVKPMPTVVDPPNQTVCHNYSTNAINFSGAINGTDYNWTNSNSSIGCAASGTGDIPSFQVQNTTFGSQIANFVVTPILNGCIGASDTFSITVNPLPIVNAGNDISLCFGSTFTPVTTGTASVFLWNNGVFEGTPFTPTVTETYIVTGADMNCSNSDSVTVTVIPLPQFSISSFDGEDSLACDGTLSANIISGTAPYNFNWTNGASNYSTPSIQNLCSGTYTLFLLDGSGCYNSDSATINDTLIQNVLGDTLIFTDNIYQDSTIIGADTSTWIENCTFDYSLVTGATIDSYIDNGDSTIVTWIVTLSTGSTVSVDATYYMSPGTTGVYDLTLQLYCSAKSGPKFLVASSRLYYEASTIGIETHSLNAIYLYPNPTKSTLSISGINSEFSYKISDLQGKLLKQGANEKQIEIENLPAGTYVIGISTDNEVKQLRFVKL